ncbi:MAG TPA: cytidine deaminase [Polyangiaceae bacterium]|nr:cytidine deaminase [Polyangiaceae bacterium]HYQ26842.1 cytidine deaminase [Polyangiaceae bacterium]
MTPELAELVARARAVRELAYAPYSRFLVGAALRAENGRVFVGCNVENASYGATICAERSAILAMVAAGQRTLTSLAVFTDAETLAMPCGLCRQVVSEFQRDARLVVANPRQRRVLDFAEIFPEPFVLDR